MIWVLCGGPSPEFEVSLSSGRFVCGQISLGGRRRVRPVVVTRTGRWLVSPEVIAQEADREGIDLFFEKAAALAYSVVDGLELPGALRQMLDEKVDCVFLAFHGQFGEDGSVQGLLQAAGVPFTGSGILASSLAFNKAASLGIFAAAGLPVAKSVRCTRREPFPAGLEELKFPLFTKPVCGGSSLGVSLIKSREQLEAGILHALEFDDHALAEEKIEGVEVSCGVIDLFEDGRPVPRALPPTLILPTEAEFFDFDAKYLQGKSEEITPAPLPEKLIFRIQELALEAHKVLCCEGMSRTDLITLTDENAQPVLLETQTLPGMTPGSLIPQQCVADGISFAELVDHLVAYAIWKGKSSGKCYGQRSE